MSASPFDVHAHVVVPERSCGRRNLARAGGRFRAMRHVEGVVQHYAWGDRDFLPALLGVAPDGRPWAELWLGTHPNGPSTLDGRPLAEVTGPLPYLLKVLAVGEPLSLQAHPTSAQATAGFAAGRYPDDQPKPELLVALTPFEAFCGFRPSDDALALLDDLGAQEFAAAVRDGGPGEALHGLYRGRIRSAPVVAACAGRAHPAARWADRLGRRYPGDPSVAATLLLNHVSLAPGEAIFLGPGNLHAYLAGSGVELMGASDNVVRGGLTVKAVDVDDLLAVVDPSPLADPVRPPAERYAVDGTPIRLLRLAGPGRHEAAAHELVVTSAGRTGYLAPGTTLTVAQSETAYVATTVSSSEY
jgi:mannose-6-phosphate isomerase